MVDTVGFAQSSWQVDSIVVRIHRNQGRQLENVFKSANVKKDTQWKVVISPHDDYTYVGYLYPAALAHVKAHTVFLFGVAHKARKLNLANQIIFDTYPQWYGPYGPIRVSSVREAIINNLPKEIFQVNDTMQVMEHSVEALLPFLQHFNLRF